MVSVSDSRPQRDAEELMRQAFAERIGCSLESKRLLVGSAVFEVDGVNEDQGVLVEFYAHFGALKSGQLKKVLADFLKLILLEELTGKSWTKYFVFACDVAASKFTSGTSWAVVAAQRYGIAIEVVDIGEAAKKTVLEAQVRQNFSAS